MLEEDKLQLSKQKETKIYTQDDLFKNKHKELISKTIIETNKYDTSTVLVEYKKSIFTRFKNFILKLLHIKL